MKVVYIRLLIGVCFLSVALVLVVLVVYRGSYIQASSVEHIRISLDKRFEQWFIERNLPFLWLNSAVFGNGDKYSFYPPRIVPVLDDAGITRAYHVYGMVTFWDPDAKILGVNSYIGRPLYIQFDPTRDGVLGVIPLLDSQGRMLGVSGIQYVDRPDVANWDTLFCPDDIVTVEVKDRSSVESSNRDHPVIPTTVTVTRRLCVP